jgi:hypothetical protein
MSRRTAAVLTVALLAATVLLVGVLSGGDRRIGLAVEALCLSGLWLAVTVRALGPSVDTSAQLAQGRVPAPARTPADLLSTKRLVSAALGSSADLHVRLRPLLRDAAAERLRRRGLELDSGSEVVRSLLGEDAWELLRPDRPLPERPFRRVTSTAQLQAIVERVEAL